MDETEEETHPPTDFQLQPDAVSQLDCVTCELRDDLEHEGQASGFSWQCEQSEIGSVEGQDSFCLEQLENERV